MAQEAERYDVVIAGQGAAAFAAALYAARYQMKTLVVGEEFGGETAIGGIIENYPGYPEIDGFELMMKFKEQVERYDVPIVSDKVVSLERREDCFVSTTAGGQAYVSPAFILAVGRERRKLGLEHEEEWTGRGVSYCSVCDAPLHRGNVVAVVGGGNAAVEGAILLSRYAQHVYIIYRRERFTRPEPILLRQLEERDNVEPIFKANVVKLLGDENGLTGVVLDREHKGSDRLELQGLFIEIGADPRVDLVRPLGVALNEQGEVHVDRLMRTNVPGLFAAGDVTDASADLKQTVTAAAQGARAAATAYQYVSHHGHRCRIHEVGYSLQ